MHLVESRVRREQSKEQYGSHGRTDRRIPLPIAERIKGSLFVRDLQDDIIYGPVRSRRFGTDLGINLLPTTYKLCSFNCVYCQYGWTVRPTMSAAGHEANLPTLAQIEQALASALQHYKSGDERIDHMTVSGNGEPTLYPQFHEAIKLIVRLRNDYFPVARIGILSDSHAVIDPAIRQSLMLLDERCMKLDAGDWKIFWRLNLPARPFDFEAMLEALRLLEDFIIQSMFVQGRVDNTTEAAVSAWIAKINHVKPKQVQVYSLDRVPADERLQKVPWSRLQEIAQRLQQQTGIPAEAFD